MNIYDLKRKARNGELIAPKAPSLPSHIRYYDDFQGKVHTIIDPTNSPTWLLYSDGENCALDFRVVDARFRAIFKAVVSELLHRLDPTSAIHAARACLRHHEDVVIAITKDIHGFRDYWLTHLKQVYSRNEIQFIRQFMHSLCILSIGSWKRSLRPQISALPGPNYDIYKSIRTQKGIIPIHDESLLVEFLDDVSKRLSTDRHSIDDEKLANSCILALCHERGIRPGQTARIKLAGVMQYDSGSLHLQIPQIKQRDEGRLRPFIHRVSRSWAPLFFEYLDRRTRMRSPDKVPADNLFFVTPRQASRVIKGLTEEVCGTAYSATNLRHTAAQRLADAGKTPEAITEFLGHDNSLSATYYVSASPSQAKRINEALAISPIYSSVARIHADGLIKPEDLVASPPSHQIAGAPHGIPISGIGICKAGQSLCEKNPIMSCYTCRKFLPVSDPDIHRKVLEDLRPIAMSFSTISTVENESPAYTQLRRMFSAVNEVVQLSISATGAENE